MVHEKEGGIEISMVLLRVVAVKLFVFLTINGGEVGAGVFGSRRSGEFLQGRNGC